MRRHLLCVLFLFACGGSDNTNVDGGNDATTNDVANDTQGADTGGNETGGNDGGTDAVADSGCPQGNGCRACCAAAYPDATAAFAADEETCACTTPGDCKQPCQNTLCMGKQPSGQCTACLGNKDAGDCTAIAVAACIQSPSCQPLAQCVAQCGIQDAGGGG
jgi:hypothetical protein